MKTIKEQFQELEQTVLFSVPFVEGDLVYAVEHKYKKGYSVVRLIVTDKYVNSSTSSVGISAHEEGDKKISNYGLKNIYTNRDDATAESERVQIASALSTIREADVDIAQSKLDKVKAEQVLELLCKQ